MSFTITSKEISRSDFNTWISNPNPLSKNRLDIMIKGEPCTSLNGRHAYARFDSTYISFYPAEKAFFCPVPGIFRLPNDDLLSFSDSAQYTLFSIKALETEDIATPLAQYFKIANIEAPNTHTTVPKNDTWRFKFWTLTCCGLGCFSKKANCTSIIVNALPIIGITTDLNRKPTWRRMAQDIVSILGLVYLTLQTVRHAQTDNDVDVIAPIGLSLAGLWVATYLFMIYPHAFNQSCTVRNHKTVLHDNERKFKHYFSLSSDLLKRETNNSFVIFLITISSCILDMILDLSVNGKLVIIPSQGVTLSGLRLSAWVAISLSMLRMMMVVRTCSFDIQNGPQNPIMLKKLLNRVAQPELSLQGSNELNTSELRLSNPQSLA